MREVLRLEIDSIQQQWILGLRHLEEPNGRPDKVDLSSLPLSEPFIRLNILHPLLDLVSHRRISTCDLAQTQSKFIYLYLRTAESLDNILVALLLFP